MRQTTHPTEPRDLVLALFTVAMLGASVVLVAIGTLIPFFEEAFGLPKSQLGLIVTVLMLGSTLFTSTAGLAVDRFGDKAIVLATGLVMGVALIAASLQAHFWWLIVWLFVYGVGYAAVTPAGSHAILFFFDKRSRGTAMGIRQTGVPLGGVLGAVMLPFIAGAHGYTAALAAAGVVCLATSILAAFAYREPPQLRGERASARALFEGMIHIGFEPRLLLVVGVSVVLICVQIALMSFLPLTYARAAGLSTFVVAAMFCASQVAAVIGRLVWGWVSDRIFAGNRLLPMGATCIVSALAAIAVGSLQSPNIPIAALAACALGFAGEGWVGLSVIAMAEIGGEEHSGSALGFGLTLVFAAAMIAAPIFGSIIDHFGYRTAWYSLAVLALIGVVPALGAHFSIRRREQSRTIPPEAIRKR
ncbi:MAG: MFS transporter [Candidatus Eremiobacteraeota bacterium]|nr:MFS transporter [Candidatus Eremiobacteraeota bacterium]